MRHPANCQSSSWLNRPCTSCTLFAHIYGMVCFIGCQVLSSCSLLHELLEGSRHHLTLQQLCQLLFFSPRQLQHCCHCQARRMAIIGHAVSGVRCPPWRDECWCATAPFSSSGELVDRVLISKSFSLNCESTLRKLPAETSRCRMPLACMPCNACSRV